VEAATTSLYKHPKDIRLANSIIKKSVFDMWIISSLTFPDNNEILVSQTKEERRNSHERMAADQTKGICDARCRILSVDLGSERPEENGREVG
jgi:hypothetical protein